MRVLPYALFFADERLTHIIGGNANHLELTAVHPIEELIQEVIPSVKTAKDRDANFGYHVTLNSDLLIDQY